MILMARFLWLRSFVYWFYYAHGEDYDMVTFYLVLHPFWNIARVCECESVIQREVLTVTAHAVFLCWWGLPPLSLSPDLSGAAWQHQMGARERPPEERGPPVIEGALLHWAREKTFGLIVIKEIFWRTACRRVYGVDRARLYMHSCAVCEREI